MRFRLPGLLTVFVVALPVACLSACAVGGEVSEEALLQAALNGSTSTANPPLSAQPSVTVPNMPSVAPMPTGAPPASTPSMTTTPPPTPSPTTVPPPVPVPSGSGGAPPNGGNGGVPVVPEPEAEPEPTDPPEPDVPVDPTTAPEPDVMTVPEPEPEPETMTTSEPEPAPEPEPDTMSMTEPVPEPEAVPGEPPPGFPTCPGKASDCQNAINLCLADADCANLAACANNNGCGQPKFCSACSAEIAAAGGENSAAVQAAESMYSCGCSGD